jgi:phosphoglycolate phosphatase-like HAD superfamily hydrolase
VISSNKVIIFDFDGVIVESNDIKTLAFKELFSGHSVEQQNEITAYHRLHEGISRIEKIKYFYDIILKKDLTKDKLNSLSDQFSTIVKEQVVQANSVGSSSTFFSNYSSSYDFYIASGTPELELVEIVDKRNLTQYFKGIFGSPSKKEQIISNIILKHDLNKKNVWMIGDSLTDYNAALNSDIQFIGRDHSVKIFPKDVSSFKDPFPEIENVLNS